MQKRSQSLTHFDIRKTKEERGKNMKYDYLLEFKKDGSDFIHFDISLDGKDALLFKGYEDKTNRLIVEKSLKVRENNKFVIKGNKTNISGIGGAEGVYKFFDKCIKDDFCTSYIGKTIDDYIAPFFNIDKTEPSKLAEVKALGNSTEKITDAPKREKER